MSFAPFIQSYLCLFNFLVDIKTLPSNEIDILRYGDANKRQLSNIGNTNTSTNLTQLSDGFMSRSVSVFSTTVKFNF